MTPEQIAKVRQHTLAVLGEHFTKEKFVDISRWNWNKPVDFNKLKGLNIKGLAIKATEGAHIVDSAYHKAYAGAKAAGLRVSPYLFYRPQESIAEQVALFVKTVGQLAPDDLIPTIDLERATPDIAAKHDNELLDEIIARLKTAFGKLPLIYTSRRYCEQEGITTGGQCWGWMVDYQSHKDFKVAPQWVGHVAAIQIGFCNNLDGIEGDVDWDLLLVPWQTLALFDAPVTLPLIDTIPLSAPAPVPPDLR